MWSRSELKERAKNGLRQYYGYGLLVTFVSGLLGAKTSTGVNLSVPQYHGDNGSYGNLRLPAVIGQFLPFILGLLLVALVVALIIFAVSVLFTIFVSSVLQVGKCRYFTISTLTGNDAGFGELFGNFQKGRYLNIVKIQFLRNLYEFLWGLLLVFPGVIKHYEYYMVPYLIAEYPDMKSEEAFRLSREMMDGNKLDTWILELSFIGWYLLGVLACGVGIFFVEPYVQAVYAELYLALREERLGIPRNGARIN